MAFTQFKKLSFTESGRMTTAVAGISLAAVGVAIYLSPVGHKASSPEPQASLQKALSSTSASASASAAASTSAKATASKSAAAKKTTTPPKTTTPGTSTRIKVVPGQTRTNTVVIKLPGGKTEIITTKIAATRILHCVNFKYQQDAQAVYLENLSDPGALDGAAGPNNGDGLACNTLPSDPKRAVSIPYGAYVAPTPTVAEKAALVKPAKKYFGIAEDGLPGDTQLFDKTSIAVGKAPSLVTWFSNWPASLSDMNSTDTITSGAFRGDLIKSSWSRGALPVISWMSGNGNGLLDGTDPYMCRLSEVVKGDWDTYLQAYASDIVRTNLPVAIRFDHEMNGNWYDWSAGYPQNQATNNPCDASLTDPTAPNLYVQAWQHMWNVFNMVGANRNVIWTWTPGRTDGLTPGAAGRPGQPVLDPTTGQQKIDPKSGLPVVTPVTMGQTTMAEDYPGDQYVDWVGASGYAWKSPTLKWTWARTFGETFNGLAAIAPGKPIYVAETGASQTVSPCDADTREVTIQDATAAKVAWIKGALTGIAGDPRVVGFAYFNNNIEHVHSSCSVHVPTNWRFDSSPAAFAQFKAGIADPRFSSGIMPD